MKLTLGLQAGAANQETIDILLLGKLLAVLTVDGATIEDASLLGNLVANVGLEPPADGLVHLLSLLDGGNLASANGPDGLVGNNNLLPVGTRNLGGEGSQLLLDDGDGLAGFTLLEGLAAAPDDAHATVDGDLGLGSNNLVCLVQDGPALRVAEDGPVDAAVLEL